MAVSSFHSALLASIASSQLFMEFRAFCGCISNNHLRHSRQRDPLALFARVARVHHLCQAVAHESLHELPQPGKVFVRVVGLDLWAKLGQGERSARWERAQGIDDAAAEV